MGTHSSTLADAIGSPQCVDDTPSLRRNHRRQLRVGNEVRNAGPTASPYTHDSARQSIPYYPLIGMTPLSPPLQYIPEDPKWANGV